MIEPDANVIELWQVDLSDSNIDRYRAILSDDESQRAKKFVFPAASNSFARSRCALRLILAGRLNCQAGKIVFRYEEHGKPALMEPAADDLGFNLSHSQDIGLIAVGKDRRVGIDLNRIGGRSDGKATDWVPIAKRSFSQHEQKLLYALPPGEREFAFYRIWTQKEAYTKALGDGFSYGFQTFSVVVKAGDGEIYGADGPGGLLADVNHPEETGQWHIVSIGNYSAKDTRYVAALAYDGAKAELRQLKFRCGNP